MKNLSFGALTVVVLSLTACGSSEPVSRPSSAASSVQPSVEEGQPMLDSTETVCDEFAVYARDGQPADQRSDVVSSIGEIIGNADQRLQDNFDALTNSVDGPESQWELAADVFAQTCFDTGWDG